MQHDGCLNPVDRIRPNITDVESRHAHHMSETKVLPDYAGKREYFVQSPYWSEWLIFIVLSKRNYCNKAKLKGLHDGDSFEDRLGRRWWRSDIGKYNFELGPWDHPQVKVIYCRS